MESTLVNIEVHPSFLKFLEICQAINFGKVKELSIQDGLPVFVEYIIETELDGVVVIRKKLV